MGLYKIFFKFMEIKTLLHAKCNNVYIKSRITENIKKCSSK